VKILDCSKTQNTSRIACLIVLWNRNKEEKRKIKEEKVHNRLYKNI